MDAQGRPRRVPARRRAHRGGVGEDHQAFVAAPACADAEQLDAVDQRRRRLLPAGLESEAEESGRAGEVAAPDGMAGIGRQGRIEQAVDLRPLGSEEHTSELQSLMRLSYAVSSSNK